MDLATVFKLSLYGLTAFVGVVLGTAEGGWIPFVSLPAAILGYRWCEFGLGRDQRDARGLGETPARVLGFLAFSAATMEFFSNHPEGKLLSGTHLVVYLTWVVLLQPKTIHRYWLLLALGVLQIAVSSVLSNGSWLGLCMIVYLVASIWTLSVFSLFRAQQNFAERERVAAPPTNASTFDRMVSQAFDTVRHESNSDWLSVRLVSGVALTSTLGLFVAALFFALIPRIWVGAGMGISDDALPAALRRPVTGLAAEIRLGDMGTILESTDPVLTLKLFDNQTNQPLDPEIYAEWLGQPEPLFRGNILTDYENGRWRPHRMQIDLTGLLPVSPTDERVPKVVPTVRQEIHLERIGSEILFCMGRPVAMRHADDWRCGSKQPMTDTIVRRERFKDLPGAFDYTVYSELPPPTAREDMGFVVNSQTRVIYRISSYIPRCSRIPEELTKLTNLSRDIIDAERRRIGREVPDIEKARALESYLRDSGIYSYSLVNKTVDATIDPVEDFLFQSREGHCQYFAAALGLMLRSVGIPSRLVTGFKGGERQPDGTLMVEKRFAHAWVEAWIDNERWVTLDATPESQRLASVTEVGTKRNIWNTMSSLLANTWEYNVINISYENQEAMLYRPIREFAAGIWQRIRDFLIAPHTSLLNIFLFLLNPRNWLTLPGAFALALLTGLLWLLRRGPWQITGWSLRTRQTRSEARRVEFYERFARLMHSQGCDRLPAQTQEEFVNSASQQLAVGLHDADIPRQIIPIGQLFYRVRFGDEELSPDEASQLNVLLTHLEQLLNPAGGR